MAIPMVWDNIAKTILYVDRTQKFAWDEFDQSVDESYQLIAALPHTVDVIIRIDLRVPISSNPMPHMHRMFEDQPKNLRYIVIIGVERTTYNFQTVMFELFMRLFSSRVKQIRFANSLDEARAMLTQDEADKRLAMWREA